MLFFAEYGSVKQVHLPTDQTGRLRGFGFVEMGTDAEELPLMDLMVLSGWGVP